MNFLESNQFIKREQSPLNNNISVVANHLVSEQSNEDVNVAISLVEYELNQQNVDISKLKLLNLYLYKQNRLLLELNDPGNQIQFASVNCDFIETMGYQFIRVAIIVEEMVHFYWGISDELKIKHIVLYLINIGWPLIEMDDLFDLSTIPQSKQRQTITLDSDAFDNKLKY